MTDRVILLWIDLTVSRSSNDLPRRFSTFFEIHHARPAARVYSRIEQVEPDVLCFDFDYPDLGGLKLLRETKQKHPSLPILMVTEQHSETLAVWAFRARVWDYLVKPVSDEELIRAVTGLQELQRNRHGDGQREMTARSMPIPNEGRFAGVHSRQLVLHRAVEYVESSFAGRIREEVAAEKCGMSVCQFSRAFKAEYGVTFQGYVIQHRIREACRLLRNPSACIADVAAATGFNDPSYFTRVFKRYFGFSPSDYRVNRYPEQPDDPETWAPLSV
ncbi:MAG: helix-turn-helix domain-containing protein [Woeseiaceae bacterium]